MLHQGNPRRSHERTERAAKTDVGIATEALGDFPELLSLPCYNMESLRSRSQRVIRSGKHKGKLTLEALARWPIVTYDFSLHRPLRRSTPPSQR